MPTNRNAAEMPNVPRIEKPVDVIKAMSLSERKKQKTKYMKY